jgi:hypothetical protein
MTCMSQWPLADEDLARRIEAAIVEDMAAYQRIALRTGIYPGANELRVGGGVARWFSPDNVLNGAFGLGMDREVEQEEIAALIRFFEEHDAPARIDVCPLADRSLLRWLAEAGFVATDFEMVLYQPLPIEQPEPPATGVTVRVVETERERKLWAELEARGFTDDKTCEADHVLSTAISLRDDGSMYIGYLDGEPAGTGMLVVRGQTALFNGDSTLPAARNRGVQSAILRQRLHDASKAGCDLAVIEAAAGGTSFRNQQRAGFRVAYNRVTLELPHAG